MPLTPAARLTTVIAFNLAALAGLIWLAVSYAPKPVSLPFDFWVPLITGTGAWLISGWVWALRPKNLASLLFFFSGLSTLVFTFAAAPMLIFGLSLHPTGMRWLSYANASGAVMFGIVILTLFLIYPRILPFWRSLSLTFTGVFLIWLFAALNGHAPINSSIHLITLTEMVLIFCAIIAQYIVSKNDPKSRAVLIWLGGAVLIGAGGFIISVSIPNVMGETSLIKFQYAFGFFLIIYLGMAAGLRRYRLFELSEWAFKFLFYLLAALLILAADAGFVLLFSIKQEIALGISLLLAVLFYLPFRDMLARTFLKRHTLNNEHIIEAVIDIAFQPLSKTRTERWQHALTRLFDPLDINEQNHQVDQVTIKDEGLELELPCVGDIPSLTLRYPWQGRGLFGPSQMRTAKQLITLLLRAESRREAYHDGVLTERGRIARDMHDNIGAQLLGALHHQDGERKDIIIRETLSDLREIINGASRPELSFDEALAGLRLESAERLETAHITLDWNIIADQAPPLTAQAAHGLRSIVREAISNIIKHSQATQAQVEIQYQDEAVSIIIGDNGIGCDPTSTHTGNGLANIRTRITALHGTFEFANDEGGLKLIVTFPLNHEEVAS